MQLKVSINGEGVVLESEEQKENSRSDASDTGVLCLLSYFSVHGWDGEGSECESDGKGRTEVNLLLFAEVTASVVDSSEKSDRLVKEFGKVIQLECRTGDSESEA